MNLVGDASGQEDRIVTAATDGRDGRNRNHTLHSTQVSSYKEKRKVRLGYTTITRPFHIMSRCMVRVVWYRM